MNEAKLRSLREQENFFLALADATRLRILNLLTSGEVCVAFFTDVLGESQPKISRHLAYLRGAGLVSTRRDGKWIFYSLRWPRNPKLTPVLSSVLRGFEDDLEMSAERASLGELMRTADEKIERGRKRKTSREKPKKISGENREPVRRLVAEPAEDDDLDTFLL